MDAVTWPQAQFLCTPRANFEHTARQARSRHRRI
jgi:hypothetical protein